MIWIGLVVGIVVGAGGYYLYDKYASRAKEQISTEYSLGRALLTKVNGDVNRAWLHIAGGGRA